MSRFRLVIRLTPPASAMSLNIPEIFSLLNNIWNAGLFNALSLATT